MSLQSFSPHSSDSEDRVAFKIFRRDMIQERNDLRKAIADLQKETADLKRDNIEKD